MRYLVYYVGIYGLGLEIDAYDARRPMRKETRTKDRVVVVLQWCFLSHAIAILTVTFTRAS